MTHLPAEKDLHVKTVVLITEEKEADQEKDVRKDVQIPVLENVVQNAAEILRLDSQGKTDRKEGKEPVVLILIKEDQPAREVKVQLHVAIVLKDQTVLTVDFPDVRLHQAKVSVHARAAVTIIVLIEEVEKDHPDQQVNSGQETAEAHPAIPVFAKEIQGIQTEDFQTGEIPENQRVDLQEKGKKETAEIVRFVQNHLVFREEKDHHAHHVRNAVPETDAQELLQVKEVLKAVPVMMLQENADPVFLQV